MTPDERGSTLWGGGGGGISVVTALAGPGVDITGSVPTGLILLRSASALAAAAPGPTVDVGIALELNPGLAVDSIKLVTSDAV